MRLERENLYIYRRELSKLTGYQPIVYESGVFEFHNVTDKDKDILIRKLKNCSFVDDVHSIESKYNFNDMKFKGISAQPAPYSTLIGFVKNNITETAKPKFIYLYEGPVFMFGKYVGDVNLKTYAVSDSQAINNFRAQAAKELGYDIRKGVNISIDPDLLRIGNQKVTIAKDISSRSYEHCLECGALINDSGECPVCDLGDYSALDEAIANHSRLNPKLWNDDNSLKDDVAEKVESIVNYFKNLLKDDGIELVISDIYILGSNANYNYTETSDLDIHIIADESSDCLKKHLPIIYNCYKTLFNDKYDISIKGINAEIYVENKDQLSNVATGVYSLSKGWIKKPSKEYATPKIDDVIFSREVNKWERRYFAVAMNPTLDAIDKYMDDIYDIRTESLMNDGEFGFGNLVFKEIRKLGYLSDLKDIKSDLISKELSLD